MAGRQVRTRASSIMVNIEPVLYGIVLDLLDKEGMSASGYARKLIIEDLRAKGLVPDKLLADLLINSAA